jgi:hypothetical protein
MKNAIVSLFQLSGLRFFRKFDCHSLLTAILLTTLSSPLFAATPGFDTLVNYDTAWTYVYEGGIEPVGLKLPVTDIFFDVKTFPNGASYITGASDDTAYYNSLFLVKLDAAGKLLWKKVYNQSGKGHSIVIAKNGDLIIGGAKGSSPYVMRLDTAGNVKWSTWYYDTLYSQAIL